FARIAAQTAKQVLTQRVREVERDKLYDEFKPKEGEIVSGAVHRFMERNIVVDLGKTEAILPVREQIRRERYAVGARVRAVILRVDKAQRGPQVLISRAHPLFLRRLFELEVPEVNEKIVEIVEIVRDPGFRAKVVVKSNDAKVDAIGSCVGIRGSRIRSIMNELAGERIDLIAWHEDPAVYLANSLAPARVATVRIIDLDNRRAEVIVSEEQLSLAIGKEGQNIRLACKLTGWHMEVKSAGQKGGESKSSGEAAGPLSALEGIGPKTAELLVMGGMTDPYKLAECKPEELTKLQGIGEKTAGKIIASAKKYAETNPR
ncbi:MAG: transcription termination factor NusA, partial [Elusimicrobiota bacterium]